MPKPAAGLRGSRTLVVVALAATTCLARTADADFAIPLVHLDALDAIEVSAVDIEVGEAAVGGGGTFFWDVVLRQGNFDGNVNDPEDDIYVYAIHKFAAHGGEPAPGPELEAGIPDVIPGLAAPPVTTSTEHGGHHDVLTLEYIVHPDILNTSLVKVNIVHQVGSGPVVPSPYSPGPGMPEEEWKVPPVPAGSLLTHVLLGAALLLLGVRLRRG